MTSDIEKFRKKIGNIIDPETWYGSLWAEKREALLALVKEVYTLGHKDGLEERKKMDAKIAKDHFCRAFGKCVGTEGACCNDSISEEILSAKLP